MYTVANFAVGQIVIYDGNYYHHNEKLPPVEAEVLALGEKRIKIWVYSRDYHSMVERWVDPKNCTPTEKYHPSYRYRREVEP